MLENRRALLTSVGDEVDGGNQRTVYPQGCVLALVFYNIYTNDQPVHPSMRSFLYADDLCSTSQHKEFSQVEQAQNETLDGLTSYY